MVQRRLLAAVFGALLLAPSLASAEDWFDAYARGLEALKKRDGPKAVEYLERAIRKRAEPGENLITYGTNRLPRYHPYVNLAEAYVLTGNLDKARAALAQSASGNEPAGDRGRIAALVAEAEKKVAVATPVPAAPTPVPPPGTTMAAATPVPVAPTPVAVVPTPAVSEGILEVRSEPSGASVLLGQEWIGKTPLQVNRKPGTYVVTLQRQGMADQTFSVRIEAGRKTSESRT